jgi:outer membrane protein TolC
MKKFKNITALTFTFIFTFTFLSVRSQELLTPEDAVAFAVANNFDIIIAKDEADIARINNNRGAAGMLPVIDITTGDVFNLPNINQKFTTGQEVKKNWVPVNSFTAGLNLNWTVFDGLKMFATKGRLEALESQGALRLKEQIQNSVADVLTSYFDVVREKQNIHALEESSKFYDEQAKLSQRKFEVGYSDKTPWLQAQVDYLQQQTNIIKEQALLDQAKTNLNMLMGRKPDMAFEVIDSIETNYVPDLQGIKDTALMQNYTIQSIMKDVEIAQFQRKEVNAQRLPSINFGTGYTFTQNNSKAGLQLFNRSYGPVVGVNATIPIYNGGRVKKEVEAATVNIALQNIRVDQAKNDVETKVATAYKNYMYAKQILDINEQNVKTADENVMVTLERYRLSQTSSLESRQAQASYQVSLYDVILARYNAKIAEIELKRLMNTLVK